MLKLFNIIYQNILSKGERVKCSYYIVLNIFYSILDLISVAAIFPIIFLAIGADFESIDLNLPSFIIDKINHIFFKENGLLSAGFFILSVFLIKFIFSLYISFFNARLDNYLTSSIKSKIYKKFTKKKYSEILKYNVSQVTNVMANIPDIAVGGFFMSFLLMSKALFMIFSLIIFLLFINFKITVSIFLISSAVLAFYFIFFKKIVVDLGKRRIVYNEILFKYMQEFSKGFKIIKLYKLEKKLSQYFSEKAMNFGHVKTLFKYLNSLPKISFEISIISIVFILLFLLNKFGYSKEYIISFLGIFFFVSLRLIPQVILYFSLINKAKNAEYSVNLLINEFKNNTEEKNNPIEEFIDFKENLKLDNISYEYHDAEKLFDNLNLEIQLNTKIGIVGESGSGKSTLINIICGFLNPQKGKILIDNVLFSENYLSSWQDKISLVEQDTFLFNDSIKNNIALITKNKKIDNIKLINSIKGSQLDHFIKNLPDGIETIINQDSTNLSGGEKQRLCIARALYRDSKILILDEPTSALDKKNATEIINIIRQLKNITIIIITHDEKILSICDKKYRLMNKNLNEITT